MKANELMIGDLITAHGKPIHVCGVFDNRIYGDNGCDVREAAVHAIPLTEEILKANGFVRNQLCSGNYYFAPVPDMCDVMYHISEDSYEETWHVEVFTDHNDNNYSLFNVCYVHELQHVLRLCGLNELADNFKIEAE